MFSVTSWIFITSRFQVRNLYLLIYLENIEKFWCSREISNRINWKILYFIEGTDGKFNQLKKDICVSTEDISTENHVCRYMCLLKCIVIAAFGQQIFSIYGHKNGCFNYSTFACVGEFSLYVSQHSIFSIFYVRVHISCMHFQLLKIVVSFFHRMIILSLSTSISSSMYILNCFIKSSL